MGGRKQKFRPPQSGIYILGEGITEQYYFTHLKHLFSYTCTIRPRFFCNHCITDFESRIDELLRGDIIIICVFDKDVTKRNSEENKKLVRIQNKYKKNKNVILCDSLPSIEFWFLLHFKETYRHFISSKQAEKELLKFIKDYKKSENFLKNEKWVKDMSLDGNIQNARERARKSCAGNASYSKIYLAIDKLNNSYS